MTNLAEARHENDYLVLTFSEGSNKLPAGVHLRTEILEHIRQYRGRQIIFDLSNVWRVSSPLFAALIAVSSATGPEKIILRNCNHHFKQLLSSLELEGMFEFADAALA